MPSAAIKRQEFGEVRPPHAREILDAGSTAGKRTGEFDRVHDADHAPSIDAEASLRADVPEAGAVASFPPMDFAFLLRAAMSASV